MYFFCPAKHILFHLTSLTIAFELFNYEVVALSPHRQWYYHTFADNVPKSMTVKHGPFSVSCHYMKTVLKSLIVNRVGYDCTVDLVFVESLEKTAKYFLRLKPTF